MHKHNHLFLGAAMVAALSSANAATVIDTGFNPSGTQFTFYNSQEFAAQFQLTTATTLTSLEGYFLNASSPVDLTVSVYAGSGAPSGVALFSATTEVHATTSEWAGAQGVSWSLGAGTYSVAFTTTDPRGRITMLGQPPHPLTQYWWGIPGAWNASNVNSPVQVAVMATSVPEPQTWLMSLLGLATVGGVLCRRANGASRR